LTEWLSAKGNRKKRAEIATHMVFATKYHPKSVARTFKRLQLSHPCGQEKRGRTRYYDQAGFCGTPRWYGTQTTMPVENFSTL
ncbi:MAG: hypothetical protein KBD24_00005, partial [Candidatus Pacebacteria bacterium]|nr:hypothetical protein [Candidatus Paceibacterota bacterium]